MATTIRVEDELHAVLRDLSKDEHRPIGQVIEDAIERYRKEKLWRETDEAFARLKSDPEAWADYRAEVAFFDRASMDGLENEPPYYSEEEMEEIRAVADAAESW